MEALKIRSVNYTNELWDFYKHKATIIYETFEGEKVRSMIHIHETQREPWKNGGHCAYMESYKKDFNPVLDLSDAEKIDQSGE